MNFVKPTHETCWPAVDSDLSDLEWRLRHADGPFSDQDHMAAATVIAAYRELVNATDEWRRFVIRALRKQQKLRTREVPRGSV